MLRGTRGPNVAVVAEFFSAGHLPNARTARPPARGLNDPPWQRHQRGAQGYTVIVYSRIVHALHKRYVVAVEHVPSCSSAIAIVT